VGRKRCEMKVQVQVAGGSIQSKEADTVEELAIMMGAVGYVATVNGEPVDSNYELSDYEFVSFAKPVKAG
jgi:sulfur carrier protein ThiS